MNSRVLQHVANGCSRQLPEALFVKPGNQVSRPGAEHAPTDDLHGDDAHAQLMGLVANSHKAGTFIVLRTTVHLHYMGVGNADGSWRP